MTATFWEGLPRPLIGLAPMNGISDFPFRQIQKKYGAPALIYTEFTGVERLAIGDRALLSDFRYDESQRPIVAQIYGRTPDLFRQMAVLVCELGFDGIDINMGCPSPSVVHRGCGAGLIQTPELARAIVAAARRGVAEWCSGARLRDNRSVPRALVAAVEARHDALPAPFRERRALPVSVKTRIGYETPQVDEWIPQILESQPAALALHGRTLRQGYSGLADWDKIGRAAEIARGSGTLILGNGDVRSLEDARERCAGWGLDGVLIGRASYGNPFVFRPERESGGPYRLLEIALEHARLHEAHYGTETPWRFLPMRKHLSWYVRGLPSASYLRRELIQSWSAAEAEALIAGYHAHRGARHAGLERHVSSGEAVAGELVNS